MKTMRTRCLAVAIGTLIVGGLTGPAAETSSSDTAFRFRQFERDIPSLYLLNGLYLTQEQAAKLASLLNKNYESEIRFRKEFDKIIEKRSGDLRKESDETARPAATGRLSDRDGKRGLHGRRLLDARKEILDMRVLKQREQDALADQAYALLTPSQRKTVEGFAPCFIPSADFRNPERVGQAANDTSFIEKGMARLRNAPEERTSEAMDRALDALVPYAMNKRNIKYSEEAEQSARNELAERLSSLTPKIRAMSDADFELDKANLANKVFPPENANDPGALRWKVGAYLLNTGVRDVVRARAGDVEKTGATVQAGKTSFDGAAADAKKALRAARLVRDLDLTAEQCGKLLEIVRGALAVDRKLQIEITENMRKAFEPYGRLRSELAAGQPTQKAEQEAGRFHHRDKMLSKDKRVEELLKRQAEVDKLLTAKQVDRLAREEHGPGARKPWDADEMDSIMNRAKRARSEARRAPALNFARDKEALCKNFLDACVAHEGVDAKNVDELAETQRAGEVLDRARKMDSTEFSQKQDDLAAELCPRYSKPRDPTYGARYVKGKPMPVLNETTNLLFSQAACDILEGLAKK
ncbi:MAG: hypothetical protein QME60_07940 [Verrucomicrobiota bacterium]|nr:hypothetical protein [Verrucomicrobiota bacterium]